MTPDEYCRAIESYLCRKNDGHLIRIVGPSFERVCGWAEQGIPLRIAYEGIDRCCVRYYAKPGRRRPVQIDFCEAEILDAFEAWRRAAGVRPPGGDGAGGGPVGRRRQSLPDHLKRVLQHTSERLAGTRPVAPSVRAALEAAADEVAAILDLPGPIRGEARSRVAARLADLDRRISDAAREGLDPADREGIRREAAEQLGPFRERMAADVYAASLEAVADRLLRERDRLPIFSLR